MHGLPSSGFFRRLNALCGLQEPPFVLIVPDEGVPCHSMGSLMEFIANGNRFDKKTGNSDDYPVEMETKSIIKMSRDFAQT
jgi:hypothetical protein